MAKGFKTLFYLSWCLRAFVAKDLWGLIKQGANISLQDS